MAPLRFDEHSGDDDERHANGDYPHLLSFSGSSQQRCHKLANQLGQQLRAVPTERPQ
jgi:hypothetical protein